jgi:CheY-like chemotaxis protein
MQDRDFDFSITILIADGDDVSRRHLSETLTGLGYKVLQTRDVASTWNILTQRKIDLVITDIFMPSGEGLGLLMKVKSERPEVAVIVMSNLMEDATRNDLVGSGADGVLTKPFRITKVEELISTILMKYDRAAKIIPRSQDKILIIDDDPGLLEFMAEGLRILGYEVIAKGDAISAVEAFEKENPDLIVSDYMLSGLCGMELINKLKEIHPQVPAVIVTGYPAAYPPELARADGIEGYLIKPFRINQLEQVITNLLYPEKTGEPANSRAGQ